MKSQKGFSAVVLLLSLILVVAIGFTGYFAWNAQQVKKDESTMVEPMAKLSSETTVDNTKTTDAQKYLVIKEYEITVPIDSNLSDLKYADEGNGTVSFYTNTDECGTQTYLGYMYIRKSALDEQAPSAPSIIKKTADNYYYFAPIQGLCAYPAPEKQVKYEASVHGAIMMLEEY